MHSSRRSTRSPTAMAAPDVPWCRRCCVRTGSLNGSPSRSLAGLLSEVEAYYEALTAFRKGDLDPIAAAFSRAAFAAIGNGEVLIRDLVQIRDDWAGRVTARSHASVWRALPLVMSQPAVTVNHVADRLGISKPTAQTAIDQMVAAEVLSPANNFRRNRVWVAGEIVEVLDEFAERAGRRRFAAG